VKADGKSRITESSFGVVPRGFEGSGTLLLWGHGLGAESRHHEVRFPACPGLTPCLGSWYNARGFGPVMFRSSKRGFHRFLEPGDAANRSKVQALQRIDALQASLAALARSSCQGRRWNRFESTFLASWRVLRRVNVFCFSGGAMRRDGGRLVGGGAVRRRNIYP